ncbi:effector binding domain-containing protein [Bacillus sp. FJAT-49732]|uniref:Effector binding domain-containing protein n=1 Tax=Lederbergia citrisecunda TaxID=2833583 RepID=A0A942TPH6_9BACI|nr:effector binding domain-containing protein [Lederbergia citrisecunda]MBS4201038.1 effector binding domain-containing protein [Lederbergia citrisecunda]
MSQANFEVVQLDEKKYIGVAATSSFQNITGIAEARNIFMDRKREIELIGDENTYTCVHFANEVLFTYIYCVGVQELKTIPNGMIGFTVPNQQYVKFCSTGEEPYEAISHYVKENDMVINTNAVSLEVFKFGKEENKYNADIYVPFLYKTVESFN